jgi:O-methyltransferase
MLSFLFRSARRIGKSRPPKPPAYIPVAQTAAPRSPEPPRFNPKVQWWSDQEWLARYERHVLPDGFNGLHPHRILDRRFTIAQLAKGARSLRGSTAECGVFKGVSSALICETLRDTYRDGERHFGFDSFQGLPQTGANDSNWRQGDLHEPLATSQRHLVEFPFVTLVPGWLPETLAEASDFRFRLVHIDVDIEQPTLDCLEFFYPRAVSGAVFVFDDYGFHSCPGARRAVDLFLSDKPESLIELTTGQAVFFKQSAQPNSES